MIDFRNKGFVLILLCVVVLSVRTLVAIPEKIGDLDEDGVATIYDVVRLVNLVRSGSQVGEELFPFVDVDGDGFLNDNDVNELSDIVLGRSSLSELPLSLVRTASPSDGQGGVAVTRETIISLTMPLSEASAQAISADDLYATFGGEVLSGRIKVSADRKRLTLFYDDPLPPSARIRVTLDGNDLTDSRGRVLDVDGDGIAGGILTFDFETLSLTFIPGTAVCGRVFASELTVSDGGEDPVNAPLEGVTITVDGMEETLFAVTDNFGNFRLENAPVGRFFAHVDGRSVMMGVPAGSYYPFVGKPWVSVPGEETNIGDVFLPLVKDGTLQTVSETEDTVIRASGAVLDEFPAFADVAITVPAGSLFSDDGQSGGMVGIAPVDPDRLPGQLPENLNFPIVITVQTNGATNFDTPAPICFPNMPNPDTGEILAPGAKTALMSFNHDTGRWEIGGPMTVSADGKLICTDPGVGILAPGWHSVLQFIRAIEGYLRSGGYLDPTQPWPTAPQECPLDDEDSCCVCKSGNTVLLHSGEERFERTDLLIPGRGDLHFELKRTYRSRLDYDGPLGFGWSIPYLEGLFFEDNGDIIRANGHAHVDRWELLQDGSYKPPVGNFRNLIRLNDGSYLLRASDGFKRYYREDGRLFCHEDRFGNRMLFDYDSFGNLSTVIDVFGREIFFNFKEFPDGVHRITSVVDFIGREIKYQYDGNGDLVSVRSPVVTGTSTGNDFPLGRMERYTYSSGFAEPELNHNLLSCTMPQEVAVGGPPAMQWVYGTNPADELTFDKVLSETIGGTNATGVTAGGTRTFSYEMLNENAPANQFDLPRGKATITERNGNMMEYFINERSQHILTRELTRGYREGEPDFYETQSIYDEDGLLLRKIFPEGNSVEFVYDSDGPRHQQHNIIERRDIADEDRGGGEDLVTTYAYEPLYNQISATTDPRGNAINYTPLIGSVSAERYSKRYFYDYQEGNDPIEIAELFDIELSGIVRGLGDLNSDGRTDQVFGSLIRIEAPTVYLRPDSNEAALGGDDRQEIFSETQWNDHGQVTAIIDAAGNVAEYLYYPENDPDGDGVLTLSPYKVLGNVPIGYLEKVTIDVRDSPRRISAGAPLMLETRHRYDPVGNTIGTTNPRGVSTDYEVNAMNEIITQVRGFDVSQAIDRNQLVTGEQEFKFLERFHYDYNGRLVHTEIENRDGGSPGVGLFVDRRMEYDILDNTVRHSEEVDDATHLVTEFRYDANENRVEIIHPEGNRQTTIYDERDLVFQETRGTGSPDESIRTFDYDSNENIVRIEDAEDNDDDGDPESKLFVYDGFNRVVQATDPLGNRSELEYDPANNAVRNRLFGHPPGQPEAPVVLLKDIFSHYDEMNRIFSSDENLFVADGFNTFRTPQLLDEDNNGIVTNHYEYDALGRKTYTVEDDGQVTRFMFDGADRTVEVADPIGNAELFVYDANDNVVRATRVEVSEDELVNEDIFETHYVYDQLDRLVRSTDNAGQTARFDYDSRDNLILRVDSEGPLTDDPLGIFPGEINDLGNSTHYFYDGMDRRVALITDLRDGGIGNGDIDTNNPANADGMSHLMYLWDGNSRLVGIIDDEDNETRYAYDALDRKISQTNAKPSEVTAWTYDKDDNLVQIIDPNGTVIDRSYDALDRLVGVNVSPGPGVFGTTNQVYEYDGMSRVTKTVDDNGAGGEDQVTETVYDSLSRVIEQRQNGQAISSVLAGDGKRVNSVYPGGRVLENVYDPVDRVREILDATGGGEATPVAAFSWIGPGYRELIREHGNGTTKSFLDDAGTAILGYDDVRRQIRMRVEDPGGTSVFDREYKYNRTDVRTSEGRLDDGALVDTYEYDSLYRLVSSQFDTEGASPARDLSGRDYQYDGVGNRRTVDETSRTNGLSSIDYGVNEINQYDTIAGVNRTHSPNGNLIDDGDRVYSYDFRNRLVEVREKGSNNLIADYQYFADNRRAVKDVSGTQTRFFYDGWQVCEEQTEAGQTLETFVYGPGYIDDVVQIERTASHPLGEGLLYVHQNDRMDVIGLTDLNGAVVEKWVYDDFGSVSGTSGQAVLESSQGNPYAFQGRRLDPETGLYYFRNRYYDPANGRFIQRDPIWDEANRGNQHSFVGNSPVSFVDPMGTDRKVVFAGHAFIVVDIYDKCGNKIGERSLHFSGLGKKDWSSNLSRQDFYSHEIAYVIPSTPEEDKRLEELWVYLGKNGPSYNGAYNCWSATLQFKDYGIDPPPKLAPYDPKTASSTRAPDSSPAGVREQARRLNLAWERANTVGEHLDVVGDLVGGIARDAKNDFLTFIGLGD